MSTTRSAEFSAARRPIVAKSYTALKRPFTSGTRASTPISNKPSVLSGLSSKPARAAISAASFNCYPATPWSIPTVAARCRLRRAPIRGADRVARYFLGTLKKFPPDMVVRRVRVNGQPGVITLIAGHVENVLTLDVIDGRIAMLFVIRNPDKLQRIDRRV